ncbi:MAG TPA: hypothetical protein VNA29_07745 [Sphingomicrobium sp.]|nr:hypothetical protein [Sphingomicrobium sp.]
MAWKLLSAATAGMLLVMPAAAQNADAPVDVTAAPPPSAGTVGPSQLRDFSLGGTVTRPADRPAGTAAPVPAATVPPASSTRSSATALPSAQPSGRQPTGSERRGSLPPAPISPEAVGRSADSLPTGAEIAIGPESAPLEVAVGSSADAGADSGMGGWPWLAVLAALAVGAMLVGWSRRQRARAADPGRLAFAGLVPDELPDSDAGPPHHPLPQRREKPTPAPQPSDNGVVVSTRLKPQLDVLFQPDRAIITENEVALQFDLVIANSGSAAARDVLAEVKLFSAHPGQDSEIGAFFANPDTSGDRMPAIPPFGQVALKSAVRLPLAEVRGFEVEGRKLFVPMVGFNILFRAGSSEGQASASFLVGRGTDEDEKLAPFRLDLGPRIFRGLSSRPHSAGLQR